MAKDIFKLDYQTITNKLSTLIAVPETTESTIDERYDDNTKKFLSFIADVIESAKGVEDNSFDVNCKKIDRLVKDLSDTITTYFTNNSLNSYYEEVLSSTLETLSEAAKKAGESFNADKVKATLVDILSSFSKSINEKKNAEYELLTNQFKEEFSNTFDTSIANTSTQIQNEIEQTIKKKIEKSLPDINREVKSALNILLISAVPLYVKYLKTIFYKKFNEFISINFIDKSKQNSVIEKLNKAYNTIISPIAYISKFTKYLKEGGGQVVQKDKKKFSWLSSLKEKIKTNIEETKKHFKQKFTKVKRFVRRPFRGVTVRMKLYKRNLKRGGYLDVGKNYGLIGMLVKFIINARKKKTRAYRLQAQMNFTKFKFPSIVTGTIEDFINSLNEHSTIVAGNLKKYLEDNVVESYNARKSLKAKIKKVFTGEKEEIKEKEGFSWLDFLMSIPMLMGVLKKGWRILKGTWRFLKGTWNGMKAVFRFIKNPGPKLKALKTGLSNLRNIKNLKNAGKISKTAKGAAGIGKTGAKTASKSVSKTLPFLAFATDAAVAALEAQDKDAMGAVFGMEASSVGIQQQACYTIAGALAGGQGLLETDWTSPMSIGQGLISTGMNMWKWGQTGAAIAGPFAPIGAVIGAAVGLTFSIIGTQRLARGLNFLCNITPQWMKDILGAAWTAVKVVWGVAVETLKVAWDIVKAPFVALWDVTKAYTEAWFDVSKALLRGDILGAGKALVKGVWNVGKALVKGVWNIGKSIVTGVWRIGKSIVKGAWTLTKSIVSGTWNAAKHLVSGIKKDFVKLGKGVLKVGKGIFNFGKKIIKGGIKLGSKIVKGVKKTAKWLFIHSPLNMIFNIGKMFKEKISKFSKWYFKTILNLQKFVFKNMILSPVEFVGNGLLSSLKFAKNKFLNRSKSMLETIEKLKQAAIKSIGEVSVSQVNQSTITSKIEVSENNNSEIDKIVDVDSSVNKDILDLSKMTEMIESLLGDKEIIPIPIPGENDDRNPTLATIAADHWNSEEENSSILQPI